ncbi:MAG: HNH endonuclease [Candidatus Saccharicenans sp.]|jgi:putative restriction endonuclease|nr:HNH endonuclease [Candidatus Saccharicenans sp.]
MKIYVGITDNEWYRFLASRINQPEDEVNFWLPSPEPIRILQKGDLFLFKLHRSAAPGRRDVIAGGGIFVSYSELPISLAWDTFGERNGCASLQEMRQKIAQYRRKPDNPKEDFHIGCVVLSEVFFFPDEYWFEIPGWHQSIVRGKTYNMNSEEWRYLMNNLQIAWRAQKYDYLSSETARVVEERARYGKETVIRPRLGQAAFRIIVTDSYKRACAITTEHSLPALEAAHIKPFSLSGPHEVYNGVLLRSDFHRLMDTGYITITPEYRVEVSKKLKEDFENGKSYYPYHGKSLSVLPDRPEDRPAKELLIWHNENVFKG